MNNYLINIFNRSIDEKRLVKYKDLYKKILNFLLLEDEFWYYYNTTPVNINRINYLSPILNKIQAELLSELKRFKSLESTQGLKNKLSILALSNLFKVIKLPEYLLETSVSFDHKVLENYSINKNEKFISSIHFNNLCVKYLFLERLYLEGGKDLLIRYIKINELLYKRTKKEIHNIFMNSTFTENLVFNLLNLDGSFGKYKDEDIVNILISLLDDKNKKYIKK